MSCNNNYENCNIFSPRGRLHRLKFFIIVAIINLICLKLNNTININNMTDNEYLCLILLAIIFIYVYTCAIIKRLNDINLSYWTILLIFIPRVTIFYHLALLLVESHYPNENMSLEEGGRNE